VDDPLLSALGSLIREHRTKQGYSQEGFADRCGVHRTFMGSVERGESNLSFSNLAKIAAGLSMTISELVVGVEKRVKKNR
jgi:transcriptional regulator with XRE-family HTH domain